MQSDKIQMPTLASGPSLELPLSIVSAAAVADRAWVQNHDAIASSQPAVAASLAAVELPELEWVFARDGALSAIESTGQWWAGCSIPLLAGRTLLKTLDTGPAGSCFLSPDHAGLVVAARERLNACTPIFVIQPDAQIARMILSCADFAFEIHRHRLWFFTGPDWAEQLRNVFATHPGLATPMQFIRTRLSAEDVIAPLIACAQDVFSQVLSDRIAQISELIAQTVSRDMGRMLLIGRSEFRLWEQGTAELLHQLQNHAGNKTDRSSVLFFDTDDPMNSAPIALLRATRECGMIVSANIARADSNQVLPREIPWISWITTASAPLFTTAGPRDALILADPAWRIIARQAGWPDDRVKICGWSVKDSPMSGNRTFKQLALIVDTACIEIPAAIAQFSSHRLLWELIEEELRDNPLIVENADDYLADRASQLNIARESLDRRAFVFELIFPAYQQGLARMVSQAGLPLSIWGKRWNEITEFNALSRGPVWNRAALTSAIAESTALIYCWPERAAHPIELTGRPVVHRSGTNRAQFLQNAERTLARSVRKPPMIPRTGASLRTVVHEIIAECKVHRPE